MSALVSWHERRENSYQEGRKLIVLGDLVGNLLLSGLYKYGIAKLSRKGILVVNIFILSVHQIGGNFTRNSVEVPQKKVVNTETVTVYST